MSARTILGTITLVFAGACALSSNGLGPASSNGVGGDGGTTSSSAVSTSSSTSGSSSASTTSSSSSTTSSSSSTTSSSSSTTSSGSTTSSSSSSTTSSSSSTTSSSSSSSTTSSSSSSGVTCDDVYHTAPGYQLCAFQSGMCDFNVNTSQTTSCGQVCGNLGGECVTTIDNGAACEYLPNPDHDCAYTGFGTAMCRCKLGCGNGAPCPSPKVCSNGACN